MGASRLRVKLGRNAPLMKLRKLCLSLRRDHYGLKMTEKLEIVEFGIKVFKETDVSGQ